MFYQLLGFLFAGVIGILALVVIALIVIAGLSANDEDTEEDL